MRKPLTLAHQSRKGTVLRRLNRREYANTMNDLFGTHLDLESLFPEDGRSHEFDNVGSSLSISMVQLKRYLEAADSVMTAAIAKSTSKPEPTHKHATYAETREGERFIGKAWKQLDDKAVVFFRGGGYPSGMLRTANTRMAGRYRIRVTGYAYQSKKPVTFAVGATTFQRGAEKPTFGYFAFPPNRSTTIELEAWIERNYMIDITPWGLYDTGNKIRTIGADRYQGPGLAIQHVELDGPIVAEFPSRGHRLIFDGIARKEVEPRNAAVKRKSWYKPQFAIASEDPAGDARQALSRVASRAFRRPVAPAQLEKFVALFESEQRRGIKFEAALRTAVAAIFCSPDFLYLQEKPGQLDDYALAARLSYFLTRTSPDKQLLTAAKSGQLTKNRGSLLSQVKRLLNDSRSA